MKHTLLLIPLLLAGASPSAECADGGRCVCDRRLPPQALIDSAGLIVEGTIVAHYLLSGEAIVFGRVHTFSGFDHAVMLVSRVWKGAPRATIVVYDANHTPGDSCDRTLLTGKTYLLLVPDDADSIPIGWCSPIFESGQGEAVRALLGPGKPLPQ